MKNLFKITYVRIYSLLGILVFSFTSSVTLHGQTVAELQTEIDNIEAGSGLESDGRYRSEVTDPMALGYDPDLVTNYLSEATSLRDADNRLDEALNAEATARSGADSTLQGNIDAEATARSSRDNTLQTSIDTVQTNINAEVTTRSSADSTLQGNINNEASARASADNEIQNNLNLEAGIRASGDSLIHLSAGLEADGTYSAS